MTSDLARLRGIYRHVSPRRRLQFLGLLGLSFAGIVAELMTIGAVVPILLIALSPDRLADFPIVNDLISSIGNRVGIGQIASTALLLTISALAATVIRLLMHWYAQRLVFALNHDLATKLYGKMLRQPFEWYSRSHSSAVLSAVDKVYHISTGVVLPLVNALTSLIIATFIAALLFAIHPFATAMATLLVGCVYLGLIFVTRHQNFAAAKASARLRDERTKVLQESSGGIRDILLDQTQPVFEAKFSQLDHKFNQTIVWGQLVTLMPRIFVEGALIVLIALLALWFQRQPGGLIGALPALGALAIGAQRLLPLVQQIYAGYGGYSLAIGNIDDVLAMLNSPVDESIVATHGLDPLPFEDRIECRDIGFSYTSTRDALSDINLTIRSGQRIGIIGKTGSGKSTLSDLLMGLLAPTSGGLFVDGVKLTDQNIARWKLQIAHVPQFIFLSDDSIAANVAFGLPQIDRARVADCIRQAGLANWVDTLPDRLDTFVGERGVRLSGGQRQRIGIARALYKNARLLILDEATSSLDTETEKLVMGEVNLLAENLTIVIIAHRLSTVAQCDQIVRLDNGRIAAIGPYDDVVGQAN